MEEIRTVNGATRRTFLSRATLVGASLTVPGWLAACSDDDESKTGSSSESLSKQALTKASIAKLTARVPTSVPFLDIVKGFDASAQFVLKNSLESLTTFDSKGAIVPALAESWKQSDPTTFIYNIREGVTFWDGSPLTVEDVIWSLQRNASKRSVISNYFVNLNAIEKTGPAQVTMTLKKPDSFFQYAPAYVGGFVVSKRFGEKAGDNLGRPGTGTMGTGPYIAPESWKVDEALSMDRNPSYWNEDAAGTVEHVDFRVVSDESAALLGFQSGELEAGLHISAIEASQYERIDSVNVLWVDSQEIVFWAFNTAVAPFDDVHVRKAWAYCCDREGVRKAVYNDHATVATAMTPPNQWAGLLSHDEALKRYDELPQYDFNVDEAGDELKQSKVPDGFSATLKVGNGDPDLQRIALATAENLSKIGIKLTVKEVPEDAYTAAFTEHDVPVQICHFHADNNDPLNQQVYICDSQFAVKGQYNMANYKNKDADSLLATYGKGLTGTEKTDTALAVLRNQQENLPYFTMVWPQVPLVLRNDLGYEDPTAITVNYGSWIGRVRKLRGS